VIESLGTEEGIFGRPAAIGIIDRRAGQNHVPHAHTTPSESMRLTVGPLSEGPRNFDEDDAAAVVVGGTV
jgi:hypothetical protein